MSSQHTRERAPLTVRPALCVGRTDDAAEVEADAVADIVMSMPARDSASAGAMPATGAAPTIRRACGCSSGTAHRQAAEPEDDELYRSSTHGTASGATVTAPVESRIASSRGGGSSLPHDQRSFFEPRFGTELSDVRLHKGAEAAQLAASIDARAFTVGSDIFFGAGEYEPGTDAGRLLLAHEITHTQQHGREVGTVRRAVELRPPGRGEASAFDRRQELVDRLNTISTAVTYRLDADDRTLLYNVDDAAAMTEFDRKMTGFIDAGQVIPLRLITSAGRVQGGGGTFVPLTADSFITGYVDLDDLLGSSDLGFQLLLAHFITERLQVRNYARRIGTAGLAPLFNRAHARGREAEAEVLQDVLGDPSIRHHFDELKPNGTTFVRAFRSVDEGYRVFWVIRGHGQRAQISVTDIRVVDGTRRLTIDEFIAERAAVAP